MNKVILIGRLTKDPDIHYTQSQNVTCNFTLAVNREFKNQNGQYEADFIPVVLWGKTAEAAGNSLAKGHRLCVEGRMQVRTYEDKQGKTVWVTEVIGNRIPQPKYQQQNAFRQDGFSNMGTQVPFDEEVPF